VKLLDQSENFAGYLANQEKAVRLAHANLVIKANDLTKIREGIAKRITGDLEREFKFLALPGTRFSIEFMPVNLSDAFDRSVFGQAGVDVIDFLISTNVGEPLKPLSKTVSGGEMSRIMLAFKTVFIQSQNLSTIIFDEIDTGISGMIASQIAKKIKAISMGCQVLSISHLPQVVATADHHLKIAKLTQNNRTIALVSTLSFDERVREIAEMIAGKSISAAAIENAKELMLEK
jgi:DNA repair protein RecN (Recombination protein N)